MTDGSKRDARVSSVAVDSQVLTVVEGTARSHRAASCLRQGVGASRLPLPTYWHQERASSKSTPWPRPTTRSDGDRGRPACDLLGFDVHHSPEFKSSAGAMPTGGHVVAGYQGGVGIGPAGMVGRGK